MRIAALYDIHGNLPAVEAVLRDAQAKGIDTLVIGGDIVPGPMPAETLEFILGWGLPVNFILGNGEVDALDELYGSGASRVPEQYREMVRWSAEQIGRRHGEFIRSWSKTLSLVVKDFGKVQFCHGTPRDENEIFTRDTPEDRLAPIFDTIDADLVVCGHTHMQFDRMIGKKRVVNAGSAGMPFGRTGADWLIIGPDVEFMHTDYDLEATANLIRQTGFPDADGFINTYLLEPPSEERMLAAYSRVPLNV
jgi:predicted phosphodiesterase